MRGKKSANDDSTCTQKNVITTDILNTTFSKRSKFGRHTTATSTKNAETRHSRQRKSTSIARAITDNSEFDNGHGLDPSMDWSGLDWAG